MCIISGRELPAVYPSHIHPSASSLAAKKPRLMENQHRRIPPNSYKFPGQRETSTARHSFAQCPGLSAAQCSGFAALARPRYDDSGYRLIQTPADTAACNPLLRWEFTSTWQECNPSVHWSFEVLTLFFSWPKIGRVEWERLRPAVTANKQSME